jgi:phytoene dehydrogenase-like protein
MRCTSRSSEARPDWRLSAERRNRTVLSVDEAATHRYDSDPRRAAMGRSVAIVGAGIAGLAAGCYGQMNRYDTRVFEMHTLPGGLCTAWKRNGYTIDGCIHWLVGSSPGNPFYQVWQELGAIQGRTIIDHEEYVRIERPDGPPLTLYTNLDRLRRHLLELAPEDRDLISEFIRGTKGFARMSPPMTKIPSRPAPIAALRSAFRLLPHVGRLRRWSRVSIAEFSQDFNNSFLRGAFPLAFDLPDFPMIGMMMTLAWMHNRTAGYPLGGSLPFARAIERRYLDLGGEVLYEKRVTEILVERDRAVGVRTADGKEHPADIVVSAADGHSTIFELLSGRYVNSRIHSYYDRLALFPPLLFVGLGVSRRLGDFPKTVCGMSFPLSKPVVIDERRHHRLAVQASTYDPSLAPPGKTTLRVMLPSSFDRWRKLSEDVEAYRTEKEQVAERVIAALDQRFPGLPSDVEMADVATPVTWHRYTGNWQGSFEGWLLTPETLSVRMRKTLPGLSSFYMIGQWIRPGGGLPTAALSGKRMIQCLCKQDRKRFSTTIP